MTTEELSEKMDHFMTEVRDMVTSVQENHVSLLYRLNSLDLNGSAEVLKKFGVWLREHPDFMIREAETQTRREERERAMRWISTALRLREVRRVSLWVLTAIFAGFLLAFGTDLYNLKPLITGLAHHVLGIG